MQHSDTEEEIKEPEGPKRSKRQLRRDWQHDTQYGWDMFSSQESDVSRVPCSLEVPMTQVEPTPFDPPRNTQTVVPETPGSQFESQTTEADETEDRKSRIEHITKNLQEDGYTVFTHKMQDGKIMHLALHVYPSNTI